MLFYLIRHGDPIYNPDQLTPLGHRQAEAVAKRLALHGLDRVYVSSSNRAQQTAEPTCEVLKLKPTVLDWCNEGHAWHYFANDNRWFFADPVYRRESLKPEHACPDWYNAPAFAGHLFGEGVAYYEKNAFDLFRELGFDYTPQENVYRVIKPAPERVALFAHQGFGMCFLSTVLRIPYPVFSSRFNFTHTGITVLEMHDEGGFAFPEVVTLSDTSHLYAEGLPLKYNNCFYF